MLSRGGNVVRLSGLYSALRGPHAYYMKLVQQGSPITGHPEERINLIHYDDATDLVLSILHHGAKLNSSIFLGVDDEPLSRRDICTLAQASGQFPAGDAAMTLQVRWRCGIVNSRHANFLFISNSSWIHRVCQRRLGSSSIAAGRGKCSIGGPCIPPSANSSTMEEALEAMQRCRLVFTGHSQLACGDYHLLNRPPYFLPWNDHSRHACGGHVECNDRIARLICHE